MRLVAPQALAPLASFQTRPSIAGETCLDLSRLATGRAIPRRSGEIATVIPLWGLRYSLAVTVHSLVVHSWGHLRFLQPESACLDATKSPAVPDLEPYQGTHSCLLVHSHYGLRFCQCKGSERPECLLRLGRGCVLTVGQP